MKFAEELFPKGTFNGQKSDGAFIEDSLAANLDTYAKKIVQDMHFCLILSGNDSVGNGKSTLASHEGSYLTWKINKLHKINNTFTHRNMVFKAKNLIKRSFELPKYSVIVLDEGDDLTEHGMKETARQIKKYFRKCRQLNQILILILPAFFELPRFYALSRSHCLVNVKFMGEFDRGFFDFYGPKQKKLLYLKGKRDWNYDATTSDFSGRFFASYCFFPNTKNESELYCKAKYEDMIEDDDVLSIVQRLKRQKVKILINMKEKLTDTTFKTICEILSFSIYTGKRYLDKYEVDAHGEVIQKADSSPAYINICNEKGNEYDETEGGSTTKQKEVINNEDKD